MFRFRLAVAAARSWLIQHGVASEHIDAGYELNGWWLYAPSPSLPSGRGPEPDVPFVTSNRQLMYKIANAPEPGYTIVRRLTWAGALGR
jgi:hypothetical protein